MSTSACVVALRLLLDLLSIDRNPDASSWLQCFRAIDPAILAQMNLNEYMHTILAHESKLHAFRLLDTILIDGDVVREPGTH